MTSPCYWKVDGCFHMLLVSETSRRVKDLVKYVVLQMFEMKERFLMRNMHLAKVYSKHLCTMQILERSWRSLMLNY